MSQAIKALYRNAGLTPPDGKGIHSKRFHQCVVEVASKQGGKIHGKVNAYAVCMKSLGRDAAVKKAHRK